MSKILISKTFSTFNLIVTEMQAGIIRQMSNQKSGYKIWSVYHLINIQTCFVLIKTFGKVFNLFLFKIYNNFSEHK